MSVSQYSDRENPDSERNQRSFFKYIALPLFNEFREVFPPFVKIARQARKNDSMWGHKFIEIAAKTKKESADQKDK